MLQLALSVTGPADAFAAALEAHRLELVAHRAGKPGIPVPFAPILDSLIQRVPRGDPYPDDFVIVPYEIVDDGPTLEQRKSARLHELNMAVNATRAAIISPARLQLLNLDMGEALNVPEESRTVAQAGAIEAYVAVEARNAEIARNAALVAIEIEDLADVAAVDAWKVPEL